MKNRIIPILLFPMLPIFGCSNGETHYLKPGETSRTGKLSQTISDLTYVNNSFYTSDPNEVCFKLTYILHSYYEKIIALSNVYSYEAIFDGNSNNGHIYQFTSENVTPTSIAPDSDENVVLCIVCFKDWETMKLSYKDTNNVSYLFSIRSSDYSY